MARPLRIEFAGALYHITARGNERRSIFFCDEDRLRFLSTLNEVCERFNWHCHAYCQMSNHYANQNRAMAAAYGSGAYSMREIAAYFAVGRMTVSRAVKQYSSTSDSTEQSDVQWET